MLTSENGRLLLTLCPRACSLSRHGGRSWLCSAGLSSMAHPGQLLQPRPLSTSHLQTLPQASWAILGKDFFHRYPTRALMDSKCTLTLERPLELLGQAEQAQAPYEPQTQQEH